MAFKRASKIIGPPADALADALESIAADELQIVAEYDAESYQLLYVADCVVQRHGDLAAVEERADALFDYYHIDFLERDLLENMVWLGDVEVFVTLYDGGVILRAHTGDAAVFVALEVTASLDDVHLTIQNTLLEPNGAVSPRTG